MTAIYDVHAREIIDSRGNPTVEVDVVLDLEGLLLLLGHHLGQQAARLIRGQLRILDWVQLPIHAQHRRGQKTLSWQRSSQGSQERQRDHIP